MARSAQERAEELARLLALAEAAKDAAEMQSGLATNAAKADAGRAATELRFALRGKEKEVGDLQTLLQKAKEQAAKEVLQAAKGGQQDLRTALDKTKGLEAELRDALAKIAKLTAELDALRKAASSAAKETLRAPAGDDFRKQAEREAAERKAAEARLAEVKDRLEKQQKRHDEQLAQLRSGKAPATPAASAPAAAPAVAPAADSTDLTELRRKLAAALEELAAVKEEFEKKKESWRITSLKRHAEMNKVEQALKVATTNEQLLKKKADMLELTVLSHQKSMDKERVQIVQGQLKEHNQRLEQQTQVKDLHANATQRKTFEETYNAQMGALNGKLKTLQ